MPYLPTSQEWLQQSSLLLKAKPTTTRITTKYNLPHPSKASKSRKRKAPGDDGEATKAEEDTTTSAPPPEKRAMLDLKTYDPESGACLKYRTNKAAEVGRLIASLGRLGRHMAALPEVAEDAALLEAPAEQGSGTHTPIPEMAAAAAAAAKETKPSAGEQKSGQGGGGGKKKKKGKK